MGNVVRHRVSRSTDLFFAAVLLASAVALAASARLSGAMDGAIGVYQLVPYALAAVLAGIPLTIGPGRVGYRRWVIACALAFAAGCAFALLRESIQEGWWSTAGICDEVAPTLPGARPAALLLERPISALCDSSDTPPDDSSFATVAFLYSAVMAFVCAVVAAVNDFDRAGHPNS